MAFPRDPVRLNSINDCLYYTYGDMPQKLRIGLIILGLTLIFCSLVVLSFTFWPAEILRIQATLDPTVFVSP